VNVSKRNTVCTGEIAVIENLRLFRCWPFIVLLMLFLSGEMLYGQVDGEYKKENQLRRQSQAFTEEEKEGALEIPVVDSTYVVGPGDQLAISIFGTQYYSYKPVVNSDGAIIIANLGKIYVRDMTLREVRSVIKEQIRRDVPRAEILVSLARARKVKVTIAGAVKYPGVVLLPASARVSETLERIGGTIPDTTALRNIRIQRLNGKVETADLLRYYRLGDLKGNPFVTGGDVIYFPPRDQMIGVLGAVGTEGWIDYVPGERLFDAIEVCQGFRASAFLDSVELVRFKEDNVSTYRIFLDLKNYPDDQSQNIELKPGDLVLVRSYPRYHFRRLVYLYGEVKYAGVYAIEIGGTKLSTLIQRAGGFTEEASLEEATVTRRGSEIERDREYERLKKMSPADMREDEYEYFKARSRERRGQMVVNFKKLFILGDSTEDIILRDGDVVEIPKKKNYISIIGQVNSPGNVIYDPKWNYLDYVSAAGGFGWRSDEGDVRIVKARTGELVDADELDSYELEPGDTIWVPEVPEVRFWEIALTTLGVISQLAGIVGIIIAVSR